jgi:magnesium chelatase family protein
MIAKIYSCALSGMEACRVTVEVHVGRGIGFFLSGLPDDAIKECRSRIEIALQSNGFEMPRTKLSVNLAPAHVRKMGTAYDLPLALGILLASGQVRSSANLEEYMLVGEVGMDGSVYGVRGALSMTLKAREEGLKGIILPCINGQEAALVDGIAVYGIRHLSEVLAFVQGRGSLPHQAFKKQRDATPHSPDFNEVKGQLRLKRGLEIAAAGGHNCLIIGPPGVGKTMLVKRLPSILPPLSREEALETTEIYSISQQAEVHGLVLQRPFRSPHHTISDAGLAGGGSPPGPGELSLAHNGVLFLDELPEFRRSVIEVLRQPLEEGRICIGRAKAILEFPASFMLVASMNPCPCGYFGDPVHSCSCSRRAIQWYRRKISGPLMDRFDLHMEAEAVSLSEMMDAESTAESSAAIQARVMRSRDLQQERFTGTAITCNAKIPDKDLHRYCNAEEHAKKFLARTLEQQHLSVRAYARILKLARTIADLGNKSCIELSHVAEAVHFRSLDKPLSIPPRTGLRRVV